MAQPIYDGHPLQHYLERERPPIGARSRTPPRAHTRTGSGEGALMPGGAHAFEQPDTDADTDADEDADADAAGPDADARPSRRRRRARVIDGPDAVLLAECVLAGACGRYALAAALGVLGAYAHVRPHLLRLAPRLPPAPAPAPGASGPAQRTEAEIAHAQETALWTGAFGCAAAAAWSWGLALFAGALLAAALYPSLVPLFKVSSRCIHGAYRD
jgi:hypothetical protein